MVIRLIRDTDEHGVRYTVPSEHNGHLAVDVPVAEALHARVYPIGLADRLLREHVTGRTSEDYPGVLDPTSVTPYRIRAGSIVIRDGRMLFIRCPPRQDRPHFEIPGGGIEAGESLTDALYRELHEETGLHGETARQVATVYRSYQTERVWLDHYFVVDASGSVATDTDLDLDDGETPVWIPLDEVPTLPAWPRRLCWRIAYWHEHSWPDRPVELADCLHDVHQPGDW